MTDYTTSERSARMAAKRRAEGWGEFRIWTPPDAPTDQLRRVFPSARGGVEWLAVIKAALAHADHKPEGNP